MLLQYFVLITFASGVISNNAEKANLSTSDFSEHKFELSTSGIMSIGCKWEKKVNAQFNNWISSIMYRYIHLLNECSTWSTRYTVVPRFAASRSMAVPGLMKCDTSAMWTPTWKFPFGRSIACRASSMSEQSGGSTEQIGIERRSSRLASSWNSISHINSYWKYQIYAHTFLKHYNRQKRDFSQPLGWSPMAFSVSSLRLPVKMVDKVYRVQARAPGFRFCGPRSRPVCEHNVQADIWKITRIRFKLLPFFSHSLAYFSMWFEKVIVYLFQFLHILY